MDLLKNEIERKRKELAETNVVAGEKKYFKRGELQQVQTQKFYEKAFRQQNEQKQLENEEQSAALSKSERLKKMKEEDLEKKMPPRNEVVRRLREKCQPIRLFGESDMDAFKRLNQIEINESNEIGMRNDFKMAIEKSEQESLNEIMNSSTGTSSEQEKADTEVHVKDDEINFNEILELSKNQRDKNNDSILVYKYIKYVVKKWGQNLNSRSLEEKLTVKGKIETALYNQSTLFLKPLQRKLKTKTLPDDILDSLVKIFLELIDRNYIKANEYFLEMAIGNSPWPIGATMVGIHARPGRERIASKHVAHVLNDETQRKYIQGVKRLISKCQQYFPTDPSRCVEYGIQNDNITIIPK